MRPEQAVGPAGRLLTELVANLGVRFGREHSFRMSAAGLHARRFLLSLGKQSLGGDADERLLQLGRSIGMADQLLETIRPKLRAARFVHFGYEEDENKSLYKLYMEAGVSGTPELGNSPHLLHVAYKWEVRRPEGFLTAHYHWHPGLSLDEIAHRLSRTFDMESESAKLAEAVLRAAGQRMAGQPIRYMEVEEEGNQRRSFDLNLYDAELRIVDLLPILQRMGNRFGLPAESFAGFCASIADSSVGHLAGGRHRLGQEFFTVYHGVEAFHG